MSNPSQSNESNSKNYMVSQVGHVSPMRQNAFDQHDSPASAPHGLSGNHSNQTQQMRLIVRSAINIPNRLRRAVTRESLDRWTQLPYRPTATRLHGFQFKPQHSPGTKLQPQPKSYQLHVAHADTHILSPRYDVHERRRSKARTLNAKLKALRYDVRKAAKSREFVAQSIPNVCGESHLHSIPIA